MTYVIDNSTVHSSDKNVFYNYYLHSPCEFHYIIVNDIMKKKVKGTGVTDVSSDIQTFDL